MRQNPDREKWNEFDWELELRKDDARVNVYVSDLPKYIDLPNEDAVIMDRMRKRPDLAPAGGDWSEIGPVPYGRDDEDDEDDDNPLPESSAWKNAPSAPLHRATSRLARDWSIFYAVLGDSELMTPTMRILCLYGKIMARSGDIIDMAIDPEDSLLSRPLKIALCKRLLSDINVLIGEMFKLHALSPIVEQKCLEHENILTQQRDILLDSLCALRAEK